MPTFLVESYLPDADASPTVIAARLANGLGAEYRCSLVLPHEDIVFHVVDGPSLDAVSEAATRARLRCQRISQVVLISAEVEGGSR
jgi:hypothetical protein